MHSNSNSINGLQPGIPFKDGSQVTEYFYSVTENFTDLQFQPTSMKIKELSSNLSENELEVAFFGIKNEESSDGVHPSELLSDQIIVLGESSDEKMSKNGNKISEAMITELEELKANLVVMKGKIESLHYQIDGQRTFLCSLQENIAVIVKLFEDLCEKDEQRDGVLTVLRDCYNKQTKASFSIKFTELYCALLDIEDEINTWIPALFGTQGPNNQSSDKEKTSNNRFLAKLAVNNLPKEAIRQMSSYQIFTRDNSPLFKANCICSTISNCRQVQTIDSQSYNNHVLHQNHHFQPSKFDKSLINKAMSIKSVRKFNFEDLSILSSNSGLMIHKKRNLKSKLAKEMNGRFSSKVGSFEEFCLWFLQGFLTLIFIVACRIIILAILDKLGFLLN